MHETRERLFRFRVLENNVLTIAMIDHWRVAVLNKQSMVEKIYRKNKLWTLNVRMKEWWMIMTLKDRDLLTATTQHQKQDVDQRPPTRLQHGSRHYSGQPVHHVTHRRTTHADDVIHPWRHRFTSSHRNLCTTQREHRGLIDVNDSAVQSAKSAWTFTGRLTLH